MFRQMTKEKESWLTKLIELLNEYDKPLGWYYEDWVLDCKLNLYEYMAYEWICSARYWFIKWLVENDKIDLDKVKEIWIKHNGRMDVDGLYRFSVYERLLMLLAISDTPIEDLISYLK
jgi:hypothetical protein